MCGSNEANVDPMSPAVPQPLELLFLQNPEQLRLQRQGYVPDFIQKQAARICHFEAANLLRNSSGEGSFLVTKELAFQ
jgi:hypothetical protein